MAIIAHAQSTDTCVHSPCESVLLGNTSFEELPNSTVANIVNNVGFVQTNQNNIPYWKTTASDQNIEIWKSGYDNISAYSGNYFAELNATQVGTLYQPFTAIAPISVVISFAHRGRYTGMDTMEVLLLDPTGNPTVLGTYYDNRTAWRYYTTAPFAIPYNLLGAWTLQFKSISSNSGAGPADGGNFLDSITVTCATVDPCKDVQLTNTGFEQILNGQAPTTFVQTDESNIPGWSTTATDQKIEIWRSGYGNVPAYAGLYFAELNATQVGTLYQPFTVTGPIAVTVSFAHRGRYPGVDMMEVLIVDTVTNNVTSLGTYSDNDSTWRYYTLAPQSLLPGNYYLEFKSISSNGGNGPSNGGNFLDSISVTCAGTDPCHDVWIQRTATDDGTEPLGPAQGYIANLPVPNPTLPWGAPGVWNTVNDPTGMEHQNPVRGASNVLRVQLNNRGCVASSPGHLYVYITPIQTWMPVSASAANLYPNNPGATDGNWPSVLPSPYYVVTPSIPAGGSTIINIPWTPPAGRSHCCFNVRYENPEDRLKAQVTDAIQNPIADNNVAHKNVDIIDSVTHTGTFSIGNPDSVARPIDLHFNLNTLTANGSSLNSLGIIIKWPPPVYTAWVRGGSHGNGIAVLPDSSIRLTGGAQSDLLAIPLAANQTADVSWEVDSIQTPTGQRLQINVTQYTEPKDSFDIRGVRLDDGLSWDIRTIKRILANAPKGGDTIASERPTNRPMHVQTHAIYVSNGNSQRGTIDRVIVGVEGKAAILAVGPPQDSAKTCISLARDRTGRSYVYQCAPDDYVQIYAGEVFRPIYITVSTPDTGSITIDFKTLSATGDTLTDSKAFLTDRLPSSAVNNSERPVYSAPSLLSSYPNPVSTTGTVRFVLPTLTHGADLEILDASGRSVQSIMTAATFEAGLHEVNFNASDLPSGAYFLMLRTDEAQYTSNLKIVH
ncbi:MAG: T9SS type A sorting domain-containing protein [Bacteroidota bacterium]|nr:T9SS type A sorting domain-containing protein [Bacteroidota bacterium]MDP4232025.1 T9SS type A sorting domain-containing protein [Bacteroidota bacterium]MDP4241268.1 T9SS type A sorting domain-containing protein [Bacteroidota bacterium]MDP4286660.1 T9SS type A sorting domain-containing protein [Bacteroidota bacterium]